MRLTKFLKVMTVFTMLALFYINLQMQIFNLAYQGKKRDQEIRRLQDENGGINYNILSLKSVSNLGGKLLNDSSGMKFADNENIITLRTKSSKIQQRPSRSPKNDRKPNILISLFSLKSQAEAKPIESP